MSMDIIKISEKLLKKTKVYKLLLKNQREKGTDCAQFLDHILCVAKEVKRQVPENLPFRHFKLHYLL